MSANKQKESENLLYVKQFPPENPNEKIFLSSESKEEKI